MIGELRKILARILFCDEDDLDNVLLHIPVGVVIVLLCLVSGWLALIFGYGFIKYETIERKTLRDKCFPDIQGCLWGIGILGVILLIAR